MRNLTEHPLRVLSVLLVLAFVLVNLSGISRYKNATGGLDLVLSNIFWFGFLVCALLFLAGGAYVAVRRLLRHRSAV